MGGTTAKASIIEGGRLTYADEYEVGGGMSSRSVLAGGGGYALKLPVIDISEVGAGGGSIAWLDKAGSLKVGPESAGAVPGPACYGAGNRQPTVTDANVVLGYLNPESAGRRHGADPRPIWPARAVAEHIAGRLGRDPLEAAYGIHTVANANMMKAVKAVTTYRGRDPRDYALLAFGGSGGMHAVDLARVLQIDRVILPHGGGRVQRGRPAVLEARGQRDGAVPASRRGLAAGGGRTDLSDARGPHRRHHRWRRARDRSSSGRPICGSPARRSS